MLWTWSWGTNKGDDLMVSQIVLRRIAFQLTAELKKAAPAKDGRLRDSIRVVPTSRGLRIKMVNYGKFIEFGTPPHTISPKSKKALAFKIGGDNVVVKKVKHPGTRPNPFIRKVLNQKLAKIVKRELSRK